MEIIGKALDIFLLLLTLPGSIELAFLTFGAFLSSPFFLKDKTFSSSKRAVVIIPAHNEETGIEKTLIKLKEAQNEWPFDIVVVADNCQDQTAEKVIQCEVKVLVRNDNTKTGKGYALQLAYQKLLPNGYDVFIVIDADTLVDKHAIKNLMLYMDAGADAVQARYELLSHEESFKSRLLNIAFIAFNHVRARGRQYWGLSVGIFGNGFALSREVLLKIPYQAHSIVEDLEYHLHLVEYGYCVLFAENVVLKAPIATSKQALETQRTRWEGGRFRLIREHPLKLFKKIINGKRQLIEPLLDLLLLPIAYHCCILLFLMLSSYLWIQIYASASLVIVILYIAATFKLGKLGIKDFLALLLTPCYLIWKISLLLKILISSKKNALWIRTKR